MGRLRPAYEGINLAIPMSYTLEIHARCRGAKPIPAGLQYMYKGLDTIPQRFS